MSADSPQDVAIIGMGCIFPGAPDLETYWRNIESGVDAISEVPAARWDPVFYDPSSNAADRFYCKRGGFVDAYASFDALGFGIMPIAAQGAEPDQLIALEVASRALADAGYDSRSFARDRTAVILGRGNYIGAGMTRLEQHVRTAQQLVECLRTLVPGLPESRLNDVKREFQSQLGTYGPDTAIGLVPNLTSSRIANRLDLKGAAYTVDAACASSLIAVDHAVRELQSGRSDMVLAGGVHLSHDVAFWSVFCQLGALSRSQQIRPFDAAADGILIGEGVGIVALKRLADARRDGDRIYASICGVGVSSDGRDASLMVPRVEGQLLALERAWATSGVDRGEIGLVEAHGTGTPVGDAAELATLARFFGGAVGERAVLGSVKSMIGHAMPAAGAAGLIKAALSVYHGVLPPSLHCRSPHAGLSETRFQVVDEVRPWEVASGRRIAGVNAFGFGGTNAHVVLASESAPKRRSARRSDDSGDLLVLAAPSREALLSALDEEQSLVGEGPVRLVLTDPTPERRAKARAVVMAGKSRRGRDGLWFSERGLLSEGGKLIFVYPGVEASFDPRVEDVARAFGKPLSLPSEGSDLERQGAGIITVGRLLFEVFGELGVRPDSMAGHSVGEWTGMITSGMIPEETLDGFLGGLNPGSLEVLGVAFAACGASMERVTELMAGLPEVLVTHDNCPHQVILCGPEQAIDTALARLADQRVLGQKLPFRSGFHSPLFTDLLGPHRAHLERLELQESRTPLWSATRCAPYPRDGNEIRQLAIEHLVSPVRFRELTQAMWDDGGRVFVQLGTGSLVGFIGDTLRGQAHVAISTSVTQRSGMAQLRRVAGALFVEGADVEWTRLLKPPTSSIPLSLGVPLVRLEQPLPAAGLLRERVETGDPVMDGFEDVMEALATGQQAVRAAWKRRKEQSGRPTEKTVVRRLSVESCPSLLDHCLIPQPEGWSVLTDRNPVVPMTMAIRMVCEAAMDLVPETVAIRLENYRAYKWLSVAPPVEVEISAQLEPDGRVRVALVGYSEGLVTLAPAYPIAPAPRAALPVNRASIPITAEELYSERWMFHGPAYQGVRDMLAMSNDGIRGTLTGLEAEGGLLDNAGQLFGFWVMASMEKNRLAMPIQVTRMDLFSPEPAPATEVDCSVWVTHTDARKVRCDMELVSQGRVWARIQGWEDWRFDTDERVWPVMHRTEGHLFATPEGDGVYMVCDPGRSEASRDYLATRFLGRSEREQYEGLAEARKVSWLYGRIAAKDAVRADVRSRTGRHLFPVEVPIEVDRQGRPIVGGEYRGQYHVSIGHKDDIAVAIASSNAGLGIDIERVAPRDETFATTICAEDELTLLPDGHRDVWLTRVWCAKEVIGKRRGTGITGSPKAFSLQRIEGETLVVEGLRVMTRRVGDYVIGWCV